MKKFLLSLALLSMTSLLLTACNKQEATEETTPSGEESVMEPTDTSVDTAKDGEKMMEEGEKAAEGTKTEEAAK